MHQVPAAPAQAWAWDKVAQMVKLLDETPPEQAEWILFMQPDTVIDDVGFTFPFEFYQARMTCSAAFASSAPLRCARLLLHRGAS